MRNVARFSFSVIAAALLAGCGASPTPIRAPGAMQQAGALGRVNDLRKACANALPGSAECLALISDANAAPNVSGWGPADFQQRYQLPSDSKGSGQVVAVVDAYDNPNVTADLAAYRANFGLGTATFYKYNQRGQQSNYPQGSAGWGVEIDLDVEMVSATCPLCTIYLIEADSAETSDLDAAEVEAVKLGAHIVSNSWGCYGSGCNRMAAFKHRGVIYVAASGDAGFGMVGLPAAFPTVASVGGTILSKSGSQYSETAWSSSEGGCVVGVKKPKWQHDKSCGYRLANDTAAVAADVATYDSYGFGGWGKLGGTAVSAPLIAGIFGLAGNAASQDGGRTFWRPRHHKYLYAIGGCSTGYQYGQYTTCTGWGSPAGIGAF